MNDALKSASKLENNWASRISHRHVPFASMATDGIRRFSFEALGHFSCLLTVTIDLPEESRHYSSEFRSAVGEERIMDVAVFAHFVKLEMIRMVEEQASRLPIG